MKEWWNNLSQRDQFVMIIGSIVLGLIFSYTVLWSPLNDRVDQLNKEVKYQHHLLSWMKGAQKEFRQTSRNKKRAQNVGNAALLGATVDALKAAKLDKYAYQIEQTEAGKIKLNYTSVPFDLLLEWSIDFWSSYQVVMSELDITPLDKPGFVKAQLIFSSKQATT